jgi:hypothetical protein
MIDDFKEDRSNGSLEYYSDIRFLNEEKKPTHATGHGRASQYGRIACKCLLIMHPPPHKLFSRGHVCSVVVIDFLPPYWPQLKSTYLGLPGYLQIDANLN